MPRNNNNNDENTPLERFILFEQDNDDDEEEENGNGKKRENPKRFERDAVDDEKDDGDNEGDEDEDGDDEDWKIKSQKNKNDDDDDMKKEDLDEWHRDLWRMERRGELDEEFTDDEIMERLDSAEKRKAAMDRYKVGFEKYKGKHPRSKMSYLQYVHHRKKQREHMAGKYTKKGGGGNGASMNEEQPLAGLGRHGSEAESRFHGNIRNKQRDQEGRIKQGHSDTSNEYGVTEEEDLDELDYKLNPDAHRKTKRYAPNPDLGVDPEGDSYASVNRANNQTARASKRRADAKDAPEHSVPKKPSVKEMMERHGLLSDSDALSEDDITALTSTDEDGLNEEVKERIKTVFESAVNRKVETALNAITEEYDDWYEDSLQEAKDELEQHANDYLTYVAEEWMKENELAVESGIRTEIAESFIEGLKELFEDHYIEVPEDKVDVVENLERENDELEDELNATVNENIDLKKQLHEMVKDAVIAEETHDLTATDAERVKTLVESVDFEDEDSFRKRVNTLKESYFKHPANKGKKKKRAAEDSFVTTDDSKLLAERMNDVSERLWEDNPDNDMDDDEDVKDPEMQSYVKALERLNVSKG